MRLGDVHEINTPNGLAYLQYIGKDAQFGALIRILPGIFSARPQNFMHLVRQKESFITFFPLGAAAARGIVTWVAYEHIPESATFALFRAAGNRDPKTGKVLDWWLCDDHKSWPIGELRPEYRHLPIQEIVNDTLLIERIVNGWTPEQST
jgi:hypothetical protein